MRVCAAACVLLAFAGTEEKRVYLDSREFPGDRKQSPFFSARHATHGGKVYAGLCPHASSSQR